MRERDFIDQNKRKWEELEVLLEEKQADPSDLGELFVKVSDDLSYAQTFYRFRSVRVYLNTLARKIFDNLYKRRKVRKSDFVRFWAEDLPLLVYEARGAMRLSFLFFALSVLIGVFSSIYDPGFARFILGDGYVLMTEENIASGDPLAVYRSRDALSMSVGIAMNNLWVDMLTFFSGLFAGIGSLAILLYNGIMVGTFQYFFIERDLFWTSFLTIWLHGTLEMSAAVISGAAGLTMGMGLLFPGTLSRIKSFRRSARRGVQILMGIVPLTLIAAFVEGFFSRYTHAPQWVRGFFIFLCLAFVIYYYVYLPIKIGRKRGELISSSGRLTPDGFQAIRYDKPRSGGELFVDTFSFFRKYSGRLLPLLFKFSLFIPLLFLILRLVVQFLSEGKVEVGLQAILDKPMFLFGSWNNGRMDLNTVLLSGFSQMIFLGILAYHLGGFFFEELDKAPSDKKSGEEVWKSIGALFPLMGGLLWSIHLFGDMSLFLEFVLISWISLAAFISIWKEWRNNMMNASLFESIKTIANGFSQYIILALSVGLIGFFLFLFLQTPLPNLLLQFISMNFFVADDELGSKIVSWAFVWMYLFTFLIYFTLVFIAMGQLYFAVQEVHTAGALKNRIEQLGMSKRIRGLEKEERGGSGKSAGSILKAIVFLVSFFLFSSCFFSAPLQAQAAEVQGLDKKRWEALVSTVDYPPLPEKEKEKKEEKRQIEQNREKRSAELWIAVFRVLGLVILIAVIVWGIASLAAGEPLFMPKKKKIGGELSGEQTVAHLRLHLEEADIETPLQQAERNGEYALAVRLIYLQALQLLVQKKLVIWSKDKTNGEFLRELSGTDLFALFSDLTRIFDYTGYGEYSVDAEAYALIKEKFEHFFTELRSTSFDNE